MNAVVSRILSFFSLTIVLAWAPVLLTAALHVAFDTHLASSFARLLVASIPAYVFFVVLAILLLRASSHARTSTKKRYASPRMYNLMSGE